MYKKTIHDVLIRVNAGGGGYIEDYIALTAESGAYTFKPQTGQNMKRVGVIGSVNRDTVVWKNGIEGRGLGGILYTALGLGYLGRGEIEVWLYSKIGKDVAVEVMDVIAECTHINTHGVDVVPLANFHCRIKYRQDGSKEERLTGSIPPLSWADIAPLAGDMDCWLVNFITGFELELATFKKLRRESQGPILLDVHSLTLGRKENGRRFFHKPENWTDWVALADVVQMNETEAGVLGEMVSFDKDSLSGFMGELLKLGPIAVALTLGSQGVLGRWRAEEGEKRCHINASEPEKAVDTTGCGDVFLAGLAAGLLSDKPFDENLLWATKAASINSQYRGLEGLTKLEDLAII